MPDEPPIQANTAPEVNPPDTPEIAKDHALMLDVHLPHPTHTWRDFWIHLGTISVGLLIAISLEQGVEALHRLHQRHQLEESFHAECEENERRAEVDFDTFDDHMAWLLALHQDIETMLATGGKANLPYRSLKLRPRGRGYPGTGNMPLTASVWDTAMSSDRLTLLPDEEARGYSATYRQQGLLSESLSIWRDALMRQHAFEANFADPRTPATPVLKRMSKSQLEEYAALTMQSFAAVRDVKRVLKNFYGNNRATLNGELGTGPRIRDVLAAQDKFTDDFDKMANQIDAK